MEKIILIRYGELSTKKGNRNFFVNLLEKNIKNLLKDFNIKIIKDRVRMYIYVDNIQIEDVAFKLKNVFGIQSIVICYKVNNNIDDIQEKILNTINNEIDETKNTFKVITKRAYKQFPVNSMEFNNLIGSLVLQNTSLKVDVHNPHIKVNIEIRQEGTFIYYNEIKGAGGYPVGVQGKGMLLLSGGIDSPVAGYLSLKRGVDLECIYFESPPHTSISAKNKVIQLANIINNYSGNIKLHVVPFTKIQEEIYKKVNSSYSITIMRRMMYRIAEKIALERNCKIIINGESIGQVASQTLDSMVVIDNVVNMPVIRPVACLDKLEIIKLAKDINTYETSILPYEDCCTIFLPKHPVIHPLLSKCLIYEELLEYEQLINDCVKNIETITNFTTNDFQDLL